MPCTVISFPTGKQIIPEDSSAFFGPNTGSHFRKNSSSSSRHIAHIEQPRGNPISCPKLSKGIRLIFPCKVKMGLILSSNSVICYL